MSRRLTKETPAPTPVRDEPIPIVVTVEPMRTSRPDSEIKQSVASMVANLLQIDESQVDIVLTRKMGATVAPAPTGGVVSVEIKVAGTKSSDLETKLASINSRLPGLLKTQLCLAAAPSCVAVATKVPKSMLTWIIIGVIAALLLLGLGAYAFHNAWFTQTSSEDAEAADLETGATAEPSDTTEIQESV